MYIIHDFQVIRKFCMWVLRYFQFAALGLPFILVYFCLFICPASGNSGEERTFPSEEKWYVEIEKVKEYFFLELCSRAACHFIKIEKRYNKPSLERTHHQLWCFKTSLHWSSDHQTHPWFFVHASGLQTNLAKSSVSPIHCSGDDFLLTSEILSCPVKEFPCTYLGLPLSLQKHTKVEFYLSLIRLRITSQDGRHPWWIGLGVW
jgi:hypothetical protein